jgi:hypothetical protein
LKYEVGFEEICERFFCFFLMHAAVGKV